MRRLFCALLLASSAQYSSAQIFSACDAPGITPVECYVASTQVALYRCITIQQMAFIEYGFEDAHKDTNGEKVKGCVAKFFRDIATPHQAAMKAVDKNRFAATWLKRVHQVWTATMSNLIPVTGEHAEAHQRRMQEFRNEIAEYGEMLHYAALKPAIPTVTSRVRAARGQGTRAGK